MRSKLNVLMLGESLLKQGGIVSVQKLILEQAPPNVQYQHIPTLVDGSGITKLLAFGRALCLIVLKLLRSDVDLLHIHMSERGSAFRQAITTLIAASFRKPVVMHTHGPEFHLFYANLSPVLKSGLRWAFQKCSQFIVLSESWKTFYIEHLQLAEERVTILPNSVKFPSQIPSRLNHSIVKFLFLGRIGQRKGAFDLVQAFAELKPEMRSRSQLIFAGDGDLPELSQHIEQFNLEQYIDVIGWVDSEQRDALLAEADVFILPSYNEGLPMALLEAMSWGLPIITTPVGGIPELITADRSGILVTPGNIQQLTTSMESLIENENFRLALGTSARKCVTVFSVENYMASLMKIYSSVVVS